MKYVFAMNLMLCASLYGMSDQDGQQYGSLWSALQEINKDNVTFIVHQFDIHRPEDEKKYKLVRLLNGRAKITSQEMEDTSRAAIKQIRCGKSALYDSYHYVMTDNKLWCYNADIWTPLNVSIFNIEIASDPIIYNVSEDTTIAVKKHIENIEELKKTGAKTIVNIAKGQWNTVYHAMSINNNEQGAMIIGTIPLRVNENLLLFSGSIVLALLAVLYYTSHD